MTMHRYQSHVAWQGSTAVGYAGYDRTPIGRHCVTRQRGHARVLSDRRAELQV